MIREARIQAPQELVPPMPEGHESEPPLTLRNLAAVVWLKLNRLGQERELSTIRQKIREFNTKAVARSASPDNVHHIGRQEPFLDLDAEPIRLLPGADVDEIVEVCLNLFAIPKESDRPREYSLDPGAGEEAVVIHEGERVVVKVRETGMDGDINEKTYTIELPSGRKRVVHDYHFLPSL